MSEETEKQFFKLICYMITSARNLVDETKMYGPFRLLDAASRMIEILEQSGQSNDIISSLRKRIETNKHKVMTDQKQFVMALDNMVLDLVDDMEGDF